MRRGSRTLTVGVTALSLLVAVGCSADDDGDDAAPPPVDATTTSEPSEPTTTTTTATPVIDRRFEVVLEQPDDLPGFNVHRPADLDATGEPLPVVVWANGACLRHDEPWVSMFERWAEAGFVVISITRPPDADPDASGFELGSATADDQALAIDWAVEHATGSDGPYAGRLDVDRVIAAGNSCGGITSLALAGRDDRVRGVFVLSGSSVGPGATPEQAAEVMDLISVPVAFVVGGPEDIAGPQARQDVDLLGEGIAGWVAARSSGDHLMLSTDAGVLDEVAPMAVHWFDLVLYGTADARDALIADPCPRCEPDLWTVDATHLDDLVGR